MGAVGKKEIKEENILDAGATEMHAICIWIRTDCQHHTILHLTVYPWGVYLLRMKYMDENNKVKALRRLKLLEGQVRGLQKMVENDTYCIDVITQTSAVKQGLSNVEDLLLENHLGHCVFHQMQSGQTKKAKEEIIKVYKLKRK